MSLDLLALVKGPEHSQESARPDEITVEMEPAPPEPTPAAAGEGAKEDNGMDTFFKEVATLKKLNEKIRKILVDLKESHAANQTETRSEVVKASRDKMQENIESVSKIAHEAKTRLEGLDASNAEAMLKEGCGEGTTQQRTRSAITSSLRKKLKDLMGEFSELRLKFSEDYKEQVSRWYYTVTGEKPAEEELERIIENGEGETLFQKEFLEQGRGQILDTVAEIQERHEAIRDMERRLLELHQIFLDMSVLVESQGVMLDNIEAQVHKSVEYVGRGIKELRTAKQIQQNTRKYMCCVIIILLIIICVTVVSVVGPWASGDA
mmetsp:Transcript_1754/g.6114  ORF Transcript_1754/g.6114 Transcript_1754/m.6114 type:complete len:321 (-) Transcript_1754:141-1103(-)|eukprot:CAMPEP_0183801128 /NCGR_PEP_ID=MMETSP0803_2-20130417/26880_1 /TAXON_ID=195967 /ORGANISM="Crustomastix stigmata, Strain CCMP3273" /LENGTH=320 /DNA_ID=CAMNT_0026045845 /DNA_START=237 /DNA_END=1199 /DNA_ORIENTATION=+